MNKLCLALIHLFGAAAAYSQIVTFSGHDPDATSVGPRPNSEAAATSFRNSAGLLGSITTITFESAPNGQFDSLNVGPGVEARQFSHDLGIGGIVTEGYATPAGAGTGFNTTSAGSKFIGFVPAFEAGSARLEFTYTTPIQAWGAYIIGMEPNAAGVLSVRFNDGSAQSFSLTESDPAGVQFFGFTDSGKSIASVTLFESGISGTRDIWGIDDVQFVAVPEPSTIALLVLSGVALLMPIRRLCCARA